MYFDPKECGKRIRKMRRLFGYTQEALADQLNISRTHMCKIETSNEGISLDLLIEMAAVFNTSLDYLILGIAPERNALKHKIRSMIEFLCAMEKEL